MIDKLSLVTIGDSTVVWGPQVVDGDDYIPSLGTLSSCVTEHSGEVIILLW